MNDIAKSIEILNDIYPSQKEIKTGEYDDVADALDDAISALEKQLNNGWIPCKNRQPANEESVKYKSDFIIQDKRYELPYVATWNKGKKLWQDEEGKQIDTVVAWQPLPEPYKAD